ncbi:hypothetical protein STRTUCAR8_07783 [Streptomyces turgidiscabies Car8]|uniref:Uncharacterized protein n=1 Tax=Streptomyces turgidiscabies (strain Car8) TaxID=698760 RepID=L7FE00_STRT8|nr:hypothetical protein STRTUCAR8_07783 [Streptomyces turgidiscabies Car8]
MPQSLRAGKPKTLYGSTSLTIRQFRHSSTSAFALPNTGMRRSIAM